MKRARSKEGRQAMRLEASHMEAARATKEYAAGIRRNPKACPMFPVVNRTNGAAETICYMQGFLAGQLPAAGKRPTRRQMEAIRDDVLHDGNICDIIVGMQDSTLSVPGGTVTSHEG